MADVANEYGKYWNDDLQCFINKAKASSFADRLAPELGINRVSLVIDGKKGEFRLRNAYIARYFEPVIWLNNDIEREIELHKRLVKEAMG